MVHNAREADNRRCAVGRQPRKRIHDERHVRLALGCQHARRRKPRVIDQQGIVAACPFDGIGRIRNDHLKRFVVPMLRTDQRVIVSDVKFVKADVVQKHFDAAEVVGRQVDFMSEKT